jgi:hypothetical protein
MTTTDKLLCVLIFVQIMSTVFLLKAIRARSSATSRGEA